MKTLRAFILALIFANPFVFGEDNPIDPLSFIPADCRDYQTDEWKTQFSGELLSLLKNKAISHKSVQTCILSLKGADFNADPFDSARMVYDMLVRADFLTRLGKPIAEIKIKIKTERAEVLKKDKLALKAIKDDLSILGASETTLPKYKSEKKEKIDEKIKKEKEKIEKKEKKEK